MENLQEETGAETIHHKTVINKLGIWMDHSNANLIKFTNNPVETIHVDDRHVEKENSTHISSENTSESNNHNKEQQHQHSFYTKLGDVIKEYDEVVLFGPTEAKLELYNILKADHHFDKIKIETQTAVKMTENQQHAFVKEYFS